MELNKVVYWCKTKELVKEFLKECDEQNIYLDSERKDATILNWEQHKRNTCYRIENNEIFFDSKKWYADNGYTIIEYKGKEGKSVPNNTKSNELSTIKQMQELTADLSTLVATRRRIKSEIVQMGLDEEIKRIKAILCDNIMEV